MRAVTIREPGGPEVLEPREVPDAVAGPGQALLQVTAAGVNRADVMQRQGHYPPPAGEPAWPGLECSGTITDLGPGTQDSGWVVGDSACALLGGGGYAEQVAVPVGQLLPVPEGVGLVEAAALPEVVCTVWSNLFMAAGLQRGETVLVHGGSSGIGTMAIQLASALGAHVAVTAGSAEKLARCAELGAEVLINYRDEDFVARVQGTGDGHGADVVLDNMGAKYLARNIDVLAPNGRLVVIGLQGGASAELDLGVLLRKRAAVIATSLRARPAGEKAAIVKQVRELVWPLLADGTIRPVVHARFPLAQAARAHEVLESSAHVGKLLLIP